MCASITIEFKWGSSWPKFRSSAVMRMIDVTLRGGDGHNWAQSESVVQLLPFAFREIFVMYSTAPVVRTSHMQYVS